MRLTTETIKTSRIGVLAGGISEERDVSLRSGQNVLDSLLKQGYDAKLIDPKTDPISKANFDIAFIALHGEFGEDGTVQAICEEANIPYTGSGIVASQVAMNKLASKSIMKKHQIPTPKACSALHPWISPPCVVKPIASGSSIGVHILKNHSELKTWQETVTNPGGYFIERYQEGRQLTVGVLDIEYQSQALPILELVPKNEFYDYHAKYTSGQTEFVIPAPIDDTIAETAKEYALKLHIHIGCKGFSRTDMILSPDNTIMVLEINTVPGLTSLSDLPAQAKAAGISFDELVRHILNSAI